MTHPGAPGDALVPEPAGRRRDDVEFSDFVATRWARLVRAAVLLGCTPHEAEDVVQTALTRCLVKWRQVQRADDRDAYVYRVVVNTFTDGRRRRWTGERPTEVLPDAAAPGDATAAVDERDRVVRALAQLGGDARTAVVLRYYAHLTEQQMAVALGVAPGTVKSRLSRALRDLAPHLSDTPETPTDPADAEEHR
ncbi:SigE family RNA polymerase sigma factor [Nocardioides sp.]|uniref:SigE family RNA polymerase sigma factor n=1 Tax=Nocardioides sp. TaxID=35761 RepID=UPI003518CC9B